jgi:phosphate-selective porin
MAAALPFVPYVSLGMSVVQAKQQSAIGKFNQSVQNRNAEIAEQEGGVIDKQTEFKLGQFNKDYQKFVGKTTVSTAKAGADIGSPTSLRIAMKNAEEAEIQRNIISYEGDVAKARKFEEANFYRIQGGIARQTGRLTAMGTLFKGASTFLGTSAGSSLLTSAGNIFSSAPTYSPINTRLTGTEGSF